MTLQELHLVNLFQEHDPILLPVKIFVSYLFHLAIHIHFFVIRFDQNICLLVYHGSDLSNLWVLLHVKIVAKVVVFYLLAHKFLT